MQRNNVHHKTLRLMGNRFTITVVEEDAQWAEQQIDEAIAEVSRIEKLLTTFNNDSQTNQINANAGIMPVKVDQEVFDIIQRSLRISVLTDGAFDITYGSIDKRFWNFDRTMTALPDPETAKETIKLINYRNVILDSQNLTVFLKEKGMRIGFGGIGKGYAAERAKQLLIRNGVKSGIINAAGDLTTWGNQPNGKPWIIAVADPDAQNQAFSFLNISDVAVATSGNYEKFVIIDGKKYSHTIDPKTGYPVSGIKSVTIICPNAELADAMATPITVLGVDAGLGLINQMKGIACIIIDDDNQIYTSSNINIL
ncbi:ApbE family lipoprotein [Emticicia oligotrophica DSM 17448]|uniref:FAD:protein FMN transferase n=1 Tax=Emticicia oligotrophica (strain DSM 17448 / CIP 109782 / MTCC 6937 / GPTSA100-15) TaxID=929562 RepID=A0ABM5N5A5_EMTOG|nr:FAD:protein FMN transferase [Emticicia oligotrophica]AFK04695.1 ApbE family lipoprotein [Emticicia oligotrophica DSM 17448]